MSPSSLKIAILPPVKAPRATAWGTVTLKYPSWNTTESSRRWWVSKPDRTSSRETLGV